MSKTDGKYDENDPKIQKKLEYLAEINAKTADTLTSWQDMYDNMKKLGRAYMEEPTKEHADFTIVAFMSFFIAMEQMPEEGDIVAIARRMNEVMVMREDLTGARVFVGEEAEQQQAAHQLMQAALMARLASSLSEAIESAETPKATGNKPVLH